jgi:hypothetical protein
MTTLKRFSYAFIFVCRRAGWLSVWLNETRAQKNIGQTVEYDVRAFGAKGDGKTLSTQSLLAKRSMRLQRAAGAQSDSAPVAIQVSQSV